MSVEDKDIVEFDEGNFHVGESINIKLAHRYYYNIKKEYLGVGLGSLTKLLILILCTLLFIYVALMSLLRVLRLSAFVCIVSVTNITMNAMNLCSELWG